MERRTHTRNMNEYFVLAISREKKSYMREKKKLLIKITSNETKNALCGNVNVFVFVRVCVSVCKNK